MPQTNDSQEQVTINVETLQPVTRTLMTIGALPTSYLISMTYEEQLLWLQNYLIQTVIPAINNNAEATQEVQDIVMALQDYINDYFNNLDVQEEINNKLDKMVVDGTLNTIIGNYVQPFIDSQNRTINDFKISVNDQIAEQNAQIQAVASGSPLVASSTSEMTDTTKAYVNTTDGNWYYYNGSAWTIGGVYQATELSDGEVEINNLSDNLFKIFNFNSLDTSVEFGWEQGIIVQSGYPGSDTTHAYWYTTIRTSDFIPLDGYRYLSVFKGASYYGYLWFYDDTNHLVGSRYDELNVQDKKNVLIDTELYPNATKFKCTFRQGTSIAPTLTPSDYNKNMWYCVLSNKSLNGEISIPDEYVKETDDNMISLPSLSFGTDSYASGQTLVKDYLVSFGISNDEHTNYKELHIFKINKTNKTYELVKTITHNFGHVNSVDYCEKTDCLIFGNGSGVYNRNGSFYIYKNFSSVLENDSVTQLEISNAMEYDCSQTPFYTEDKWNVIWFDSNRNNYDLALLVTNDLRKFRVLQLAKGNYQFTYGTMISSPSGDEFNGTFKVVDEYTFDTGTTEQETDWVIQDMDYQSGKLYCGVSHNYPYYWVFTFDRLNHVINREIIPIYAYYLDGTDSLKGASAICCNDEFVIINTGLIIFKPRI